MKDFEGLEERRLPAYIHKMIENLRSIIPPSVFENEAFENTFSEKTYLNSEETQSFFISKMVSEGISENFINKLSQISADQILLQFWEFSQNDQNLSAIFEHFAFNPTKSVFSKVVSVIGLITQIYQKYQCKCQIKSLFFPQLMNSPSFGSPSLQKVELFSMFSRKNKFIYINTDLKL